MRPIKFNAWHEKRKKMFSYEKMGRDQLTLSVDGKGFINVHGDSTKLSTFLPYMIPLEYTGLEDKNGKEIYEGHILKCDLWGDELNGTAIVKYEAPGFYLDYDHNADNFPQDFAEYFYKFEIIGNIYENSELLK